jgi:hypothetical protein
MKTNPNDPLVTISEAAHRLGMNQRRTRNILVRNLIQSVRTQHGICYRRDDVDAVKQMYR